MLCQGYCKSCKHDPSFACITAVVPLYVCNTYCHIARYHGEACIYLLRCFRAPIGINRVQLCVSKEEEVKESFKGKDMTYEQYEQLKQLNDSHGQGPKEDETDTKDTADAAKRRCVFSGCPARGSSLLSCASCLECLPLQQSSQSCLDMLPRGRS